MTQRIKTYKGVLFFVLVFFMLFSFFATPVYAASKSKDEDITFYRLASAAATYYDITHTKTEKNNEIFAFPDVNINNAGGFVGFRDEDFESGFFGGTISYMSSAAQSRNYETFTENGLKGYVHYGHALQQMGFDDTNTGAILKWLTRLLSGLLISLFYKLSIFVDRIFYAMLSILKIFNPFNFFYKSVAAPLLKQTGALVNMGSGAVIGGHKGIQQYSSLSGITDSVSILFDNVQALGYYVMLPIFLAILMCSVLLFRKTESIGSRLKKFVIRLTFILLGIPILGWAYTGTLDTMIESQTSGGKGNTPPVNQILASTFVDFEAWVNRNHLALPNGTKIVIDRTTSSSGDVVFADTTNLRYLARTINSTNGSNLISGTDASTMKATFNVQDFGDRAEAAESLINRYQNAAVYKPSDYESYYKAKLTDNEKTEVNDLIIAMNESTKYKDKGDVWFGSGSKFHNDGDPSMLSASITDSRIVFSGGASNASDLAKHEKEQKKNADAATDAIKGIFDPIFGNNTSIDYQYIVHNAFSNSVGTLDRNKKGLSTLAMYNYLTTSFKDSSVDTFSNNKATSDLVLESHYSVNLIGRGASALLYYLNALFAFMVISIIGIFYALGMVVGQIRRGISFLTAMPMSMLGSMKAMARMTGIIVVMICEVMGIFFVYAWVIELYTFFIIGIETPIANTVMQTLGKAQRFSEGSFIGEAGGVPLIVSVPVAFVTLIMSIFFLVMALKLRKSILKMLREFFTQFIDKFFGNDFASQEAANTGKPGVGSTIGRAAATGAGAMLAAKAMDKFQNKGKDAKGVSSDSNGASTHGKDGKDGNNPDKNGATNPGGDPNSPDGSGGDTAINMVGEQNTIGDNKNDQNSLPEPKEDGHKEQLESKGKEAIEQDSLDSQRDNISNVDNNSYDTHQGEDDRSNTYDDNVRADNVSQHNGRGFNTATSSSLTSKPTTGQKPNISSTKRKSGRSINSNKDTLSKVQDEQKRLQGEKQKALFNKNKTGSNGSNILPKNSSQSTNLSVVSSDARNIISNNNTKGSQNKQASGVSNKQAYNGPSISVKAASVQSVGVNSNVNMQNQGTSSTPSVSSSQSRGDTSQNDIESMISKLNAENKRAVKEVQRLNAEAQQKMAEETRKAMQKQQAMNLGAQIGSKIFEDNDD